MRLETNTVLVNRCNSRGSYSVARAQSTTVVLGRIPYYLRRRKKELPWNLRVCICTVLGVEHAVCFHEVQNLSRLSIGGASWTQHIKSVF
jgi:hypothetical protein